MVLEEKFNSQKYIDQYNENVLKCILIIHKSWNIVNRKTQEALELV